ncbi:unnamed protein product [Fusarium graminearum]|uniref:Chromosome 2, complete genome n=1 Tax=Gibberella zeae (strain ATCC MYA-4620 / CBS 123657 / FGSC 9075 / NRRL 31084 / PH-1) TaxID=229533 RepID=A0A098DCY5_GIBZE|nr:unnamed protein product [Fusarium graminearum]CEF76302.1 unnamed protein product [Fusarium graminearum]
MPSTSSHSSRSSRLSYSSRSSHSSSHNKQLVKAVSSSSSKHQSKSPREPGIKSVAQQAELDIYQSQNNDLWKDVKHTQGNKSTLILAVVAPDQRKPMKRLIEDKAKHKKIQSSVVVTTQDQLQQQLRCVIDSGVKKTYKSLHLIVSSTVSQLTYHIENFVDQVFVKSCGSAGRQDALYISASSTYCGWQTYAWSHRPQEARFQKQLTHHEGCLFDMRDVSPQELSYLSQPREQPNLSDDARRDVMAQMESLKDDVVTEYSEESVQSPNDHVNSWFQQWKRLLATVIEAGANASGAGIISGMWMGSEGLIIKGPFGLYIAAGYACYDIEGSTGVACGLSVGTSMVAYDQVFLISWDRIWELFTNLLQKLWGWAKESFTWIKNKITELARWLGSFFV